MNLLVRVFAAVALVTFTPLAGYAADSLTVSVTPPLFQLTIGPGESWSSTLKIVNTNDFAVTYFATVVDFEAEGEGGRGSFTPIVDEFGEDSLDPHLLASWISVTDEAIVVPEGQSADVPFTVRVPENATPGGHYAAILVGTKPPEYNPSLGSAVAVSSYVSSLFFVKIKGDVIEKGRIREFVTESGLYDTTEADFVLRFENLGTVHLRPKGTITIYNMWGKERGKVAINEDKSFGNVLPGTIRRFKFSWDGDFSPLDIGRYSATVTLAFGDEAKQNVTATTYFWVVPVVPVAGTITALIIFIWAAAYLIRRYIRRVLALEAKARGAQFTEPELPHEPVHITLQSLARPLEEGVIDLRRVAFAPKVAHSDTQATARPVEESASQGGTLSLSGFVSKYRLFFVFLGLLIVASVVFAWYFGEILVPSRTYEISNVLVEEEFAE